MFGRGCSFGGVRVNILMYADDIEFVVPTENSLQKMMANLEEYCDYLNLRVNLN